jgi:hypothetical protein
MKWRASFPGMEGFLTGNGASISRNGSLSPRNGSSISRNETFSPRNGRLRTMSGDFPPRKETFRTGREAFHF